MKKFCTFRDEDTRFIKWQGEESLLEIMKIEVNIAVSYDKHGQRASKSFTDAYTARSFYVAKFKAGKNPRVHGDKVFSQNAEKSIDIAS